MVSRFPGRRRGELFEAVVFFQDAGEKKELLSARYFWRLNNAIYSHGCVVWDLHEMVEPPDDMRGCRTDLTYFDM